MNRYCFKTLDDVQEQVEPGEIPSPGACDNEKAQHTVKDAISLNRRTTPVSGILWNFEQLLTS